MCCAVLCNEVFVKKCKCLGLWQGKALFPKKSMYVYSTHSTLCLHTPSSTLRWFNIKCGKIECQNRFCINLTINVSIFFKNGLGIFYNPKLFKLRTEIWFIIKLSIRWKISLKTLKIAFEINFAPHFHNNKLFLKIMNERLTISLFRILDVL